MSWSKIGVVMEISGGCSTFFIITADSGQAVGGGLPRRTSRGTIAEGLVWI